MHTSPHSRGDTYRLDKGTLQWLWRDIAIGDVVYDIDCGVGAYGDAGGQVSRRRRRGLRARVCRVQGAV